MIQGPLNLDSLHRTMITYRPICHDRVFGHLGRLQDPESQLKATRQFKGHTKHCIPSVSFLD
jgi:hypothetical protein